LDADGSLGAEARVVPFPLGGTPEGGEPSDERRRLCAVATSPGARLIDAVAAQDATALAACFADDVEFRALIPPGLRERSGAIETASLIAAWFADSTELDLVDAKTEEVEDRLHISYRFQGVEEGEPYLVEQHLFCSVEGGRIKRANLLCSGFRPRPSAGPRDS